MHPEAGMLAPPPFFFPFYFPTDWPLPRQAGAWVQLRMLAFTQQWVYPPNSN